MESPLDVLSRAASMVEPSEISSSLCKRSSPRDFQQGNFPKVFKQDRLPCPPSYDSHYTVNDVHKKKIITDTPSQMHFSRYNMDNVPPYNYCQKPDSTIPSFRSSSASVLIEPCLTALASSHLEEQQSPLNLSLSTAASQNNAVEQSYSCLTSHQKDLHASPQVKGKSAQPVPHPDSAIDEHFRRSLGNVYVEEAEDSFRTPDSSMLALNSSTDPNVSITGCVDDHFAKSLGNTTWTAIKAKNDIVALDLFSGTVDDHFAKALGGDTWHKIKSEKTVNCTKSPPPTASSFSSQKVSLMPN